MSTSKEPPILPGCSVLPPIEANRPTELSPRCKSPKGKPGGRFKILNSFIDFTLRSLRRNEIAVWLVLYRDTRGDTARTSIADIARRSGASTRTVLRVVSSLEQRGLLRIVHRGGLRRGISVYRVLPLEQVVQG